MNLQFNTAAFVAFVWFAWVGSVTPGPNCMVALATGANFGARAALSHALGVMIGFSLMLAAAALGVAGLIAAHPVVGIGLRWLGITYLVWLGLSLIRAGQLSDRSVTRPPMVHESALLQLANPKAWMLVIATIGAYQGIARPAWLQQLIITLTFCVSCSLAIALWAWLGSSLRDWLSAPGRLRWFNGLAGLSLLATAVWTALSQ